jgi:hypothetical protein
VAALTFLLYDICITFDDEVSLYHSASQIHSSNLLGQIYMAVSLRIVEIRIYCKISHQETLDCLEILVFLYPVYFSVRAGVSAFLPVPDGVP